MGGPTNFNAHSTRSPNRSNRCCTGRSSTTQCTNLQLQALKQMPDGRNVVYGANDKGHGRIYAVGDCNMLGDLPPIPKISYPGEEQAAVACRQIEKIDDIYYAGKTKGLFFVPKIWPCIPCYGDYQLTDFWWPWGAGMFATSL